MAQPIKQATPITVRVPLLAVPQTDAAPDPSLAVTPEWCAAMRTARKARGITQGQLGGAIRPPASQATISAIEKGVDDDGRPVSSDRVLAISRYLEIAPPTAGQSALMQRWISVGRALEHRSPEILAAQLDSLEQIVKAMTVAAAATPDRPARH